MGQSHAKNKISASLIFVTKGSHVTGLRPADVPLSFPVKKNTNMMPGDAYSKHKVINT